MNIIETNQPILEMMPPIRKKLSIKIYSAIKQKAKRIRNLMPKSKVK